VILTIPNHGNETKRYSKSAAAKIQMFPRGLRYFALWLLLLHVEEILKDTYKMNVEGTL
jgi:hypothetical protein